MITFPSTKIWPPGSAIGFQPMAATVFGAVFAFGSDEYFEVFIDMARRLPLVPALQNKTNPLIIVVYVPQRPVIEEIAPRFHLKFLRCKRPV